MTAKETILQRSCDEANAIIATTFRELCTPARYGWRSSQLDSRQRDFIIAKHELIAAIQSVQRIDLDFYDIGESTAVLRENVLSALAAMARAMNANEREILFNQ